MKQIEILQNTEHSETYVALQKRMERSLAFEASDDELIELLERIKEGNKEVVPKLIKASEGMIYSVMLSMPESRFSIDERFTFAKQALEDLAVKELNSTGRERLLRFGAFQVKQALLEIESIQKVDYETSEND